MKNLNLNGLLLETWIIRERSSLTPEPIEKAEESKRRVRCGGRTILGDVRRPAKLGSVLPMAGV